MTDGFPQALNMLKPAPIGAAPRFPCGLLLILIRFQVETNDPWPSCQASQCFMIRTQSRQSTLQLPDYRVKIVEHPVGELFLSELIPYMFLWIEFRGIRRQPDKHDIFRPFEFLRLV